MSEWKIGGVTFPVPPRRITKKNKASLKKIAVAIEAPWIYGMGADAKALQLDGEFFNYGNKASVFTNYVQPLERYTENPMAIAFPLMNIAASGIWTNDGCSVFKATSDRYVKNDESLYCRHDTNTDEIYYQFDEALDFRNHNTVTVWAKGNKNKNFSITFQSGAFASRKGGYKQWIKITGSTWAEYIFVKSSSDGDLVFVATGTPTGWNKIRTVTIEPSGASDPEDIYVAWDAITIGLGWKVTSPGGYYDGMWMIDSFQYEEEGAETEDGFIYRMTLIDNTELHGKKERVVG